MRAVGRDGHKNTEKPQEHYELTYLRISESVIQLVSCFLRPSRGDNPSSFDILRFPGAVGVTVWLTASPCEALRTFVIPIFSATGTSGYSSLDGSSGSESSLLTPRSRDRNKRCEGKANRIPSLV